VIHVVTFAIPGPPVAKGRPRFARVGGFVRTYTPKGTVVYEKLVAMYARQAMQAAAKKPVAGPVVVGIDIHLEPPASWSKKKRADALLGLTHPTSKPDLDNFTKVVLDACNEILWIDDSQVVSLRITKKFAPSARMEVAVFSPTTEGIAA